MVKVWDMTVLDNKADSFTTSNNNVSKANMVQELKHEMAVEVIDATEDGHNIIVGDVMGDIFLWRKSKSILSRFGFVQGKQWALIHKFTWRHDIKRPHLDEIFQHSVTSLCFLDKSRFVSGTKEGLIQIWDGSSADKLQTIRVAEMPVSSVQKLSIDEPDLEGFSVCCADGRVVSLTLTIHEDDVVELDASPVDCTNRSANSSIVTSIKSIALPCNNNAKPIIRLIVGDSHGNASLTRN
jgi:WD40 repeat protein